LCPCRRPMCFFRALGKMLCTGAGINVILHQDPWAACRRLPRSPRANQPIPWAGALGQGQLPAWGRAASAQQLFPMPCGRVLHPVPFQCWETSLGSQEGHLHCQPGSWEASPWQHLTSRPGSGMLLCILWIRLCKTHCKG